MGPHLAMSASRRDTLQSPRARDVADAALQAGFTVTELTLAPISTAGESDPTHAIDFLVAFDANAVFSSRAHLVPHNLGMAILVVADDQPDEDMRRAVRLADVVIAPTGRHGALHQMPLRPAIFDIPSTGHGWRAVFDEAVANRERSQRHGSA